eukprot:4617633-Karenia_brevis.AAC.1
MHAFWIYSMPLWGEILFATQPGGHCHRNIHGLIFLKPTQQADLQHLSVRLAVMVVLKPAQV